MDPFDIGSLASERMDLYHDTDIVVVGCSHEIELGLKDIIVYDTSDGKHWFGLSSFRNKDIEVSVSLVGSTIHWGSSSGFYYSKSYWSSEKNAIVVVDKQPIPWVEIDATL